MRTVRPTWILVAFVAVVLTAGPAQAGGPTSALLVSPDSGATAALYTTDRDYRELSELVGSDEGASSSARGAAAGDPSAHAFGPSVTVTWLVHDVHVWRVDRIYYHADGGPWIFTEQAGATDGTLSPVGWQQSPKPARLTALLDQLGLSATGVGSVAGRPASVDPSAAVPDAAGSGTRSESGVAGWWWAAGGLLVGIAGTVAAARISPSGRSPAGQRQPRQQLVDL
ncbi:MAG: hypothetical protein ACRDO1_19360 [Nocardioidaceae bacterium]